MDSHKCRQRNEGGLWSYVTQWYLPVVHSCSTLIIVLCLSLFVNNHIFYPGNQRSSNSSTSHISQVDISTMVSIALVLHRIIAASWLSLTAWRMAFVSLELGSVKLKELNRIITYRLPPFRWLFPIHGEDRKLVFFVICLVLLLSAPSQFAAPLLSGAINWNPTSLYINATEPFNIADPGPSDQYVEHNEFDNNRMYEVLKAVGQAGFASNDNFNKDANVYSRRLPELPVMPDQSTAFNITIPVFRIHGIQSIIDENTFNQYKAEADCAISNSSCSTQWYSSEDPENLLSKATDVSRITIVNTQPWEPAQQMNNSGIYQYQYPEPTIDHANKLVLVGTTFGQDCTKKNSNIFGSLDGLYGYNTGGTCYVSFLVNYTAGVTSTQIAQLNTNGVTTGGVARCNDTGFDIQPDALVSTAISMMPDVLFYTQIANSSAAPTFNNIEGYVHGMLSIAFQASWDSLARHWASDNSTEYTYQYPEPMLLASVSFTRTLIWGILNALLAVSAVLLAMVQSLCEAKTVRYPVLSALLLDTSAILAQDRTGLCSARKMNDEDGNMRLRLIVNDARMDGDGYIHDMLEVEESVSAQRGLLEAEDKSRPESVREDDEHKIPRKPVVRSEVFEPSRSL